MSYTPGARKRKAQQSIDHHQVYRDSLGLPRASDFGSKGNTQRLAVELEEGMAPHAETSADHDENEASDVEEEEEEEEEGQHDTGDKVASDDEVTSSSNGNEVGGSGVDANESEHDGSLFDNHREKWWANGDYDDSDDF